MIHNITLIFFALSIIWIILGTVGVFYKQSKLNNFIKTNIYFYTFIVLLSIAIIMAVF
jgi:hypothetical protein